MVLLDCSSDSLARLGFSWDGVCAGNRLPLHGALTGWAVRRRSWIVARGLLHVGWKGRGVERLICWWGYTRWFFAWDDMWDTLLPGPTCQRVVFVRPMSSFLSGVGGSCWLAPSNSSCEADSYAWSRCG